MPNQLGLLVLIVPLCLVFETFEIASVLFRLEGYRGSVFSGH